MVTAAEFKKRATEDGGKARAAGRAARGPSDHRPELLPSTKKGAGRQRSYDIVMVRTDELTPYANNARTHSESQIEKIAASIQEFGFTNPVLVDGDNGIIAGHGRLLAARLLGIEQVPTLRLADMTETRRRAYIIADNKLALDAGWDEDLLRLELGALRDEEFDLGFTGFDGTELDALFGGPGEDPDDDSPEDTGDPAGNVCCPSCGHKFQIVARKPAD
jgi:ParB-like nuclease domain